MIEKYINYISVHATHQRTTLDLLDNISQYCTKYWLQVFLTHFWDFASITLVNVMEVYTNLVGFGLVWRCQTHHHGIDLGEVLENNEEWDIKLYFSIKICRMTYSFITSKNINR